MLLFSSAENTRYRLVSLCETVRGRYFLRGWVFILCTDMNQGGPNLKKLVKSNLALGSNTCSSRPTTYFGGDLLALLLPRV